MARSSSQKTLEWGWDLLSNRERQVKETIDGIHPGHVERYKFAAKKAKDFILDAACGCGYGSSLLHKVGDVTGIDLEQEAIDFANKHYPGPKYLCDDVTTHEGSYDWVVSLETLEHLPEPLMFLENCRKISENLIVSTPNELKYPFNPASYAGDRFPHLRHYTPDELDEILERAGWEVVEKHCQVQKKSEVTPGTAGMFLLYVCR